MWAIELYFNYLQMNSDVQHFFIHYRSAVFPCVFNFLENSKNNLLLVRISDDY